MMILLYICIICCVVVMGVFMAVQAYLMLSDACLYTRGRIAAITGGAVMAIGAVACAAVFLWMLNHSPL